MITDIKSALIRGKEGQDMTYRELIGKLIKLSEEELDQDVTVLSGNEFYPVKDSLFFNWEDDILDAGHVYLAIN